MKLTKRIIDQSRYEGTKKDEWDVRWDDTLQGFGVRIYPSGRKAFMISYRIEGRKRRMQIGDYGVLTLDQARDMARVKLTSVIQGDDPLKMKAEARRGDTVGDLCEEYLERHAKEKKLSWKDDEYRINAHILQRWKNLKARSITVSDAAALHSRIGKESGKYEANRTLELISKMFERAAAWGIVPAGHPNPARKVEKFKEEKRDRWVRPEELPKLAEQINAESNVYVKAFFWMALLTGCRRSELLNATWDNVDFSRRELRIPRTKAGRVHHVPLSDPAMRFLDALPRQKDNPFIFCGRRAGQRLVEIRKAWVRIRTGAGLPDVRLHDLRRSVGSWMVTHGENLPLVGRVLNHSNPSTTARYAHLAEDRVRLALENHGRRLTAAAEPREDPAERMVRELWRGEVS